MVFLPPKKKKGFESVVESQNNINQSNNNHSYAIQYKLTQEGDLRKYKGSKMESNTTKQKLTIIAMRLSKNNHSYAILSFSFSFSFC